MSQNITGSSGQSHQEESFENFKNILSNNLNFAKTPSEEPSEEETEDSEKVNWEDNPDKNYLEEIFKESFKKIEIINAVSRNLQKISKKENAQDLNIQKLIVKLQTFVFHYLSRGSSIPIRSTNEKGHRSPYDYLEEKDNDSYYRASGHPLHKRLLSVFFPKEQDLVQNEYEIGVIKTSKFSLFMKKVCSSTNQYNKCMYKEISNLKKIDQTKGVKYFFDISIFFETEFNPDMLKDPVKIEKVIQKVSNISRSLENDSFIGGAINILNNVSIYRFFVANPTELNFQSCSDCKLLITNMLSMRTTCGAFPEMIEAKRALVHFRRYFPTSIIQKNQDEQNMLNEFIIQEVLGQFIEWIKKNQFFNDKLSLYNRIIQKILENFIKEELPEYLQKTNGFRTLIIDSLIKIKTELSNVDNKDFYNDLQRVYLAVEEVIFLSLFFKPQETKGLNELAKNLFEKELTKTNKLSIFDFNSGMASIFSVLEAIIKIEKEKNLKEENLTVCMVKGGYYEIASGIKEFYKFKSFNTCDPDSLRDNNKDLVKLNSDVLILDLYPNNVQEKMEENDVKEIISRSLKERNKKMLTVILDITTTLCSDTKIKELSENFQQQIKNGDLNLIIFCSLGKFYSCGLDKYSGGLVTIIGPQKNGLPNSFLEKLKKNLNEESSKDPMSDEARRFFSLLFSHCKNETEDFYNKILSNTNNFYCKIENIQFNNFKVKKRHNKIPMIGICCEKSTILNREDRLIEKLGEDLYKKAWDQQPFTPLLIRSSFPFPHFAVTPCDTTLRLVVGLDSDSGKYLQLVSNDPSKNKGKEELSD